MKDAGNSFKTNTQGQVSKRENFFGTCPLFAWENIESTAAIHSRESAGASD